MGAAARLVGALAPLLLASAAGASSLVEPVKVNKCCEMSEIMVDDRCEQVDQVNETRWIPVFSDETGKGNVPVEHYEFIVGKPACLSAQISHIYQYKESDDKLDLLPNGYMRHYTNRQKYTEYMDEIEQRKSVRKQYEPDPEKLKEIEQLYVDYEPGKYCLDKLIFPINEKIILYAQVCPPKITNNWSNTDFLMRKILNPMFHTIGMVCFLVVAIIYFILPTLRDLTGNIITTVNVCMIVCQAADFVRIFSELSNHISFIIVDLILYVSLLAAFFWVNSLGYYIWKTFKSRNVFLRVTDGRKYCYYSCYAWGCTLVVGSLAVFAHFMLDTSDTKMKISQARNFFIGEDQETIGWLGISVFFAPIAFTVIVDLFFYVTTLKVIKRMNTYGRIHHKLKHNFDMFLLMFIVMTTCWLIFLLSWFKYDGLMYAHIIVNALQGPLFLYVCVLRQTHVMFLLRKTCCYNEPIPTSDWGDEMIQMNGSSY